MVFVNYTNLVINRPVNGLVQINLFEFVLLVNLFIRNMVGSLRELVLLGLVYLLGLAEFEDVWLHSQRSQRGGPYLFSNAELVLVGQGLKDTALHKQLLIVGGVDLALLGTVLILKAL